MRRSKIAPAELNNGPLFAAAMARYRRRRALWHSARLRLGDAFFDNLSAVEKAISAQLNREFPAR